MRRRPINPYERAILNALYMSRIPLSTLQVAEKTNMSWETAKKYLRILRRNKLVDGGKIRKNKALWKLRRR